MSIYTSNFPLVAALTANNYKKLCENLPKEQNIFFIFSWWPVFTKSQCWGNVYPEQGSWVALNYQLALHDQQGICNDTVISRKESLLIIETQISFSLSVYFTMYRDKHYKKKVFIIKFSILKNLAFISWEKFWISKVTCGVQCSYEDINQCHIKHFQTKTPFTC